MQGCEHGEALTHFPGSGWELTIVGVSDGKNACDALATTSDDGGCCAVFLKPSSQSIMSFLFQKKTTFPMLNGFPLYFIFHFQNHVNSCNIY